MSSSRPERGPTAGGRPSHERARLLDTLTPVVQQAGYDLEDLSVTAAGRRSLVRVVVDKDGGIDLDAVAEVSRAVSEALDGGGDAFAGPYVLEVTSPGVDRPLTEERHWRRAVGRLVSVPVGERTVTGRVVQVTDAGIRLTTDTGVEEPAWSELGPGRVQVEFSRSDDERGEE
jgi:ribosome maturation factor RimP